MALKLHIPYMANVEIEAWTNAGWPQQVEMNVEALMTGPNAGGKYTWTGEGEGKPLGEKVEFYSGNQGSSMQGSKIWITCKHRKPNQSDWDHSYMSSEVQSFPMYNRILVRAEDGGDLHGPDANDIIISIKYW